MNTKYLTEQPRRYVFSGNAAALSFRIRRPTELAVPVPAASSLPVTGGVSESVAGPGRLPKPGGDGDYVVYKSAKTSATGDYVDPKRAVAMTRHEVPFDSVPAYTNVNAEVTGVVSLGRVEIDLAAVAIQALSADYPEEPSIRCDGVRLEGVRVDGYPVRIVLAEQFFCDNDTVSKLAVAAGSGVAPQLFIPAQRSAAYGYKNPGGVTRCTLVNEIAWADKPDPRAAIQGNAIVIEDYGTVYFGEIYVTCYSRRITMVRFELGSPDGGDGCLAEGSANGGLWPPNSP